MAIIKCKMCGGDLEVTPGITVAECEYCGTKQTLPKVNEEVIQNLFNRANALRLKCEFDKAEQIYEKILQENDAESEAHWGIVLCKYGIEYVEDPKTYKRIPTCHRTSYDAVTADADYLAAIEHADAVQRSIYEAEAKAIDEIQKNILSIVKDEKPFDVFICYKETDENGKRTVDSTIANDIYYQLTQEGLKVFYAAITLEDKLGQEYEPYIFAALNSAKVMLVIGTKPQYFSAVWVKNEWSRFLKLMKSDRSKLLIPCYKDMDAYELPEEFAHLQAQDMSKIGFINDVVRGIKKVAVKDEPKETVVKETVVTANASTAPLLKRAFMFLEDGDWSSAEEYCEKVLDIDPECAEAYLGKLMADVKANTQEGLKDCAEPFAGNSNYQKAARFADEKLKTAITGYIEHINVRNENARLEGIYNRAKNAMSGAKVENAYKEAAKLFESIREYKDSVALAESCYERAEKARKDAIYTAGHGHMIVRFANVETFSAALAEFQKIPGWKDADQQIEICRRKIEELKAKEEANRLEKEQQAEIARKKAERRAKRNKKIAIIAVSTICAVVAFVIVWNAVIIPNGKYNDAVALMDAGKYSEAISAFEALDGYRDSTNKIAECNTAILDGKYNEAVALMEAEKYSEAITAFEALDGYKDSAAKITECKARRYNEAVVYMESGNYLEAVTIFDTLNGYEDSKDKAYDCRNALKEIDYNKAIALLNSGDIVNAYKAFIALEDYKDSFTQAKSIKNLYEILTAKVGWSIHLGKYEQDNNTSNGKEDIKWSVLEIKDGKMLVVSWYVLDCKPYNTSSASVTWETCSLRKWLNSDFINSAFSAEEKALMLTTTVPSEKNSLYSTNPGNATKDKVFILSVREEAKYISSKSTGITPTDYAIANGVDYNGLGCASYWLRTPGNVGSSATYVYPWGGIDNEGENVNCKKYGVRPALWIDLSKVQ